MLLLLLIIGSYAGVGILGSFLSIYYHKHSLFLLVYLDLVCVFADVGMDSFLNQLASATSDLQDEIVEGHAAEDIDVVGWVVALVRTAL